MTSKRRKRSRQLDLFSLAKHQAKKPRKLGRKPLPGREGLLPHVARPDHDERHPVHVSMKRVRQAPSFRSERIHALLVRHFAAAVKRKIKIIHYSIQHDHLHLMLEGKDKRELANGLRLLFSRIAFAVNHVARRHGSLFLERHHRRALTTPTEVRRAIVYILFNSRKHDMERGAYRASAFEGLDDRTSAPWFTGWDPRNCPSDGLLARCRQQQWTGPPPVHEPTTWLSEKGWKRAGGAIRFDEAPHVSARP